MVILLSIVLTACTGDNAANGLHIRLQADGRERPFIVSAGTSVGQFLQKQSITIGQFDKVYPPQIEPLTDNAVVTIIRVTERQECTTQSLAFETLDQKTTDLQPGETRVQRAGVNGSEQVCADVVYEDGVEKSRTPGSATIITQPVKEIVAHGVDTKSIEPVLIQGTIAYLSGGQAHVIEGNSVTQRVLPTNGSLDGRVFALAASGHMLLYTRAPNGLNTPSDTINELWLLLDTTDSAAKPIKLLDDVLYADWVPGKPYTFSYSTGHRNASRPGGYEALNDLIVAQLNPQSGQMIKANKLLSAGPTGAYSWWGTQFRWSPDGKGLAWAQADGVGTVDTKTGKLQKLLDFKVYSTTLPLNWVWVPSVTWSTTSTLLAATMHGAPENGEPPDHSPAFDLAVTSANPVSPTSATAAPNFAVTLLAKAGMWARPQFSPLDTNGGGSLAYLRSRDPQNSLNSDYDLVIADRDGSNARTIFPGADKPGLHPADDFGSDLTWSADGHKIVVVYQGNLWLIDITSGRASQLTVVENAILPRWSLS